MKRIAFAALRLRFASAERSRQQWPQRFASAVLALAFFASSVCLVQGETIKGTISDKMCGADHHGHDAAKCIAACVKKGSAYVFAVSKDRVLDIENAKDTRVAADLAKHAGHAVEVTGSVSKDGKSLKVDSIKMAK